MLKNMRFLRGCATISICITCGFVQAQKPAEPKVSQEEIASHLMEWVAPVYPAIAQAARVSGDVVVSIEIGPDGMIRSEKIVSGPPMLRQATLDGVHKWRYVPFHSGDATIAVTGTVLVQFTLADKAEVHTPHEADATGKYSVTIALKPTDHSGEHDQKMADRFEKVWDSCTHDLLAKLTTARASCVAAAGVADEFQPDSRYIERRAAYVYAATAIANEGDFAGAIPYADKAVRVVELGHDNNSGSEAAYSVRGQVRALSGDLPGGDADMSMAESFARKLESTRALKKDLQFHAELLRRANHLPEAQAMLDEAGKL